MPAGHYRPEVAMLHHKEKMQGEVLHLWDRKIELQQKGDNSDQKIKCRPLSDVLVEHLSIFLRRSSLVTLRHSLVILRFPMYTKQYPVIILMQLLPIFLSIIQIFRDHKQY